MKAAGRAVDDGLGTPEQNFEAVLFDRGVEAADNGNFCLSQGLSEVVGFEDQITGAFNGAEEGDCTLCKQFKIADRG